MKPFLISILAAIQFASSAQGDTLNRLNQNGKKEGCWKVFLNERLDPVDSAGSRFYAYELYDDGRPVFAFKDFHKKIRGKDNPENIDLPEKGHPRLLDDNIRFYDSKTKQLSREEHYVKGHPYVIKGYMRKGRDILLRQDTTNYLVDLVHFSKTYQGQRGTHLYEIYYNGKLQHQFWFRKVKGKWKYVQLI